MVGVRSSVPVNSKTLTKLPVSSPGPLVISVSGAVVSGPGTIVHSYMGGTKTGAVPAPSALTWNVWSPSSSCP